jgi:N-dimethylarginine dimethylaminohydrolase
MADRSTPTKLSAYGGDGWQPRERSLEHELGLHWANCGMRSEYKPLKSVLLHCPGQELKASLDPASVQMIEPLDLEKAIAQHKDMARAYEKAGVKVHYLDTNASTVKPNQMFMADLFFMTPSGAITARPASEVRAGEEMQAARSIAMLGIPILGSVHGHGTFEGADAMWIDDQTVMLGRGLRTNDEGARQVTMFLNSIGVNTMVVDLPFGSMHLMGMLRILDKDLAIAWPTRLAVRAVQILRNKGFHVAFISDIPEAMNGFSINGVTLGPRKILTAANNPNTQAFLEHLGVECVTVKVDELGKAAGAIGCLTGILERDR